VTRESRSERAESDWIKTLKRGSQTEEEEEEEVRESMRASSASSMTCDSTSVSFFKSWLFMVYSL
jgi:hypothetical protein